jgi:glycosyltransferase involved in cell wall biosynthesis
MGNKKVHVLQFVDTIKGGGVEEWVKEIVRLIDRERFEITVCYLIDIRYRNGFSYTEILRELGVEVIYLGYLGSKVIRGSGSTTHLHSRSSLRYLLQYLFLPYSMVLLPRLYRLHYSFVLGAIISRLCNIPMIYQATETKAQICEGRPSWIFMAFRLLHPYVKTFFTGLSSHELNYYGNVPQEKIKPIRGVIDMEEVAFVKPKENPVIAEFSLDSSYPVLLSVGRFTPEKGHIFSLEVVEKILDTFPKAKLIILGDGWEYDRVKDLVNKKKLNNNVILPGFRTDLKNFYSIADIYLRTNLIEGPTLSSCQAMAYALPVVGFQSDAPKEYIVNGENGILVPKGDCNKMADAIRNLSRKKESGRQLGNKARTFISDNLDIRNAIRDFEKEYLRVSCL